MGRARTERGDPLTVPQAQVLRYIKGMILTKGESPNRCEIQRHFGWKSVMAAKRHLKALHKKGYIELQENVARGIVVLGESDAD